MSIGILQAKGPLAITKNLISTPPLFFSTLRVIIFRKGLKFVSKRVRVSIEYHVVQSETRSTRRRKRQIQQSSPFSLLRWQILPFFRWLTWTALVVIQRLLLSVKKQQRRLQKLSKRIQEAKQGSETCWLTYPSDVVEWNELLLTAKAQQQKDIPIMIEFVRTATKANDKAI